MECPLSLLRMKWDHEPEMAELVRFMERGGLRMVHPTVL
jgi:hypothetical protein